MMQEITMIASVFVVVINSIQHKIFYVYPSDQVKALINDRLKIDAFLDNDSEVIMMSQCVYEQLKLLIDINIDWYINEYDSKIVALFEEGKLLGCCHDISINVDRVEAKCQVFVIEYCNSDLILERPWERVVRACFINENDESYTMIIKNLDESRIAKFCAVKRKHERNHEFVWHSNENAIDVDRLKL